MFAARSVPVAFQMNRPVQCCSCGGDQRPKGRMPAFGLHDVMGTVRDQLATCLHGFQPPTAGQVWSVLVCNALDHIWRQLPRLLQCAEPCHAARAHLPTQPVAAQCNKLAQVHPCQYRQPPQSEQRYMHSVRGARCLCTVPNT